MAYVLAAQTYMVVSMNTMNLSSIVASKVQTIYMEHFLLELRYTLVQRRSNRVHDDMVTTYDDAQAVLKYGATIELQSQERLR